MKTETLKTLILAAADEGKITLASIEDGADFESVAEWLEYAGDYDIETVAEAAGLASDDSRDIREINEDMNRSRARFAGIKGA